MAFFIFLVAIIAMLYGLLTIIKPFGWVRRRVDGAKVAGISFLVCIGASVVGALLDPPVPMPPRPENITEQAWADRIEVCERARYKVATCVSDDARVQEARAAVETQTAGEAARAARRAEREREGREIAWMERTKQAVRDNLRNPDSAEFRNVAVYRPFAGRDTPVVCGEVNGENGFGGMTGFQGFIGSGNTVGPFLEEQMAPGEFARSRREMCVNAAGSQG